MNVERWLPVAGWEGRYEVSDLGRVRSLARTVVTKAGWTQTRHGRVLKPTPDDEGRLMARLYSDGKSTHIRVHRLVLEAFVGPRPADMEGCHNDGDKLNNRLSNLRWDTRSSNMQDQVRHGGHAQARKTHCPKGHPYEGANLDVYLVEGGKRKQRRCRTCHRADARERMRAAYVPHPLTPKLSAEDRTQMAAMRQSGATFREIGEAFGVAHTTVLRFMKEATQQSAEAAAA